MADKITKVVEIEFDADGKKIKEVSKEIKEVAKNTEKAKKGSGGLASGFKKVGLAAAGIGAALAIFTKLADLLGKNQKVLDLFEVAMTSVNIVITDLFNFVTNNFGTVVDYFKAIFDDPLGSIEALGTAIVDNIIERFNSFLDTIGYVADAVVKLFERDFKGAMESAKMAGKELVDVYTGVNNSFDRTVDFATEAATAIGDYAVSVYNAADASLKLNKQAEIAAILQQGLIEKYDRQAEIQRQIRDDDTKSFPERIAANERLAEILQEQNDAETALVNLRTSAVQDQIAKGLIAEFEGKKQLLELENERLAIAAKVTGFESEQQINRNALDREQREAKLAAEKEIRDIIDGWDKEDAEADKMLTSLKISNMEEGVAKELALNQAKHDVLREQAKGNAEILTEIDIAQAAEVAKIEEEAAAKKKANEKAAADATVAVATATIGSLSALNQAFSKNDEKGRREAFKREKALGIASAVINTAKSAVSAYNSMAGIPFVGPVLAPIAAVAAIAAGAAQIKNITKQKYKGESGGGGGGGASGLTASGGGSAPSAPQFNTVGTSGFNQINESLNNNNRNPTKAYVVSGEVSSAQSLDRNRIKEATFP